MSAPVPNTAAMTPSGVPPWSSRRLPIDRVAGVARPRGEGEPDPGRGDVAARPPPSVRRQTPAHASARRGEPAPLEPLAREDAAEQARERGRRAERDDGAHRHAGVSDGREEARLVDGDEERRRAGRACGRPCRAERANAAWPSGGERDDREQRGSDDDPRARPPRAARCPGRGPGRCRWSRRERRR